MKKKIKIKNPLLLTMGLILQGGLDWNILTVIFPTLASRLISLENDFSCTNIQQNIKK
jgi:hypothetical protein